MRIKSLSRRPKTILTSTMSNVGAMEEAALKRKERLLALKNRKQGVITPSDTTNNDTESGEKLPKPVFRSYKPQDEVLKDSTLPATKPGDVTEKIQPQLEATKITSDLGEDVDLINLAPRKPDWDLKRDVAKKLEKLERRTQKAIAELIRERLKASNEDLALVVNAGEAQARMEEEEED